MKAEEHVGVTTRMNNVASLKVPTRKVGRKLARFFRRALDASGLHVRDSIVRLDHVASAANQLGVCLRAASAICPAWGAVQC